jgi:hypothetical protein
MKKSYLLIFTFLLFIFLNQVTILGQAVQSISQKRTTPERAAEGQTKWMESQLKFDKSLFKVIYSINLNYQVKADSIHITNTAMTSKRESYLLYDQIRNGQLKKVLSSDQYGKYLLIVESMKAKSLNK